MSHGGGMLHTSILEWKAEPRYQKIQKGFKNSSATQTNWKQHSLSWTNHHLIQKFNLEIIKRKCSTTGTKTKITHQCWKKRECDSFWRLVGRCFWWANKNAQWKCTEAKKVNLKPEGKKGGEKKLLEYSLDC